MAIPIKIKHGYRWLKDQLARIFSTGILYDHRANLWPWVLMAAAGLYMAYLSPAVLMWAFDIHPEIWSRLLATPGPWTLMLILAGAPTAWFVWLVRDRNQDRDLNQKSLDHSQKAVEHAWAIFRQLEGWAVGEDIGLQTSALYQLRPFLLGKPEGPVPPEALQNGNPFKDSCVAILRAILDNRTWEITWKSELKKQTPENSAGVPRKSDSFTPESPVKQAIEALLTDNELPEFSFAFWNLQNLDLFYINWSGKNLVGVNLTGSLMDGAILNETNLAFANFKNAVLSGASLKEAVLDSAILTNARLSKSNLSYADLTKAELINVKLSRADLTRTNLSKANLIKSNLSKAILHFSNLTKANLSQANLSHATLTATNLSDGNLNGTALLHAKIIGADFTNTNLTSADFTGAEITGGDFTNALRPENDIPGWRADANGRLHKIEGEQPGAQPPPPAPE